MKEVTLCFLRDGDQVCLAMKKRGFGQGKWNGVGGKVEEGEQVEDSVLREVREEIGVELDRSNLKRMALLHFYYNDKPEWNQRCHVFFVHSWEGEPTESEEMKPKWHHHRDIPFDEMWIDDKLWLPPLIEGEKIKADFHFDAEGSRVREYKIEAL